MNTEQNTPAKNKKKDIGSWIIYGLLAGILAGLVFGDIPTGIIFGVCLGIAMGAINVRGAN